MSALPQGWASVQLKELTAKTTTIDPGRTAETRFQLYSVPSFFDGNPETPMGAEIKSAKQRLEPGDVLLCKIVPHLNRVWTVGEPTGLPQIGSGEWIVYRGHGCVPAYLRYLLTEANFREQFLATVSGVGGSLMRARPAAVAQIDVPVAPLAEQRRIVAKLDVLTARTARARADLDRIPALAARYKQAVLQAQIPAPSDQSCPLAEVVQEGLIGLVRSKLQQSEREGTPYLRMQHFDLDGIWNEEKLTRVHAEAAETTRFALSEGDILFNTRNSVELVGKVAVCSSAQTGFLYNNNLLRLRFRQDVLPRFAFRQMQGPVFRGHLEGQKSATTSVAAIYQGSLFRTPFWVPSVDVQAEIVRRVDAAFAELDRLTAEAAAARRLLDRLDQAILAKAFRGELVQQDPADEPASVLLDRIRAERAAAPKAKRGRKSSAGHDPVMIS